MKTFAEDGRGTDHTAQDMGKLDGYFALQPLIKGREKTQQSCYSKLTSSLLDEVLQKQLPACVAELPVLFLTEKQAQRYIFSLPRSQETIYY